MNKNIMVSLFKRRGQETTRTKIFENFDQNIQLGISKLLTFADGDEPVIASITDEDHWCLITTKRTIVNSLGKITEVVNSNIRTIKPNIHADYMNGARQVKDLSYIELNASSPILLQVEAGEAFWGVYNILSHFSDRNTKNVD